MNKRYEIPIPFFPKLQVAPAAALRKALRRGYSRKDLLADLMAGAVVGMVALPLSMALAIASGVPPQHGLYTAIIAGGAIALLGGSKVQVSGPTAAFVVILAPIAARHGLGGLLLATLMAGVILMAMGLARMGQLIEFIPHPVTTGFTAGIAVVIATFQLKDFFGLTPASTPEHYIDRVWALVQALPTARWPDLTVGVLTLALLILWPRVSRKVPAPLVALSVMAVVAALATRLVPGFEVATIGSKFSYFMDGAKLPGIPRLPPHPILPWSLPGGDGQPLVLSFALLRTLLPSAFAIAVLGAIESLLSAVVADGMHGTKHDPDAELIAQGAGNILSPFFGGIAATGAIARTATNIRAGARSPIASFVHAAFVLLAVLTLAPVLGYLPMASLAALLLLVAWNMSEIKHFSHILRVAPRSDVLVLLACFLLTVIFDMVVSVSAGVMLAAVLFMRRMAEISHSRVIRPEQQPSMHLPPGVLLYQIAGPLFFGATQKAMSALSGVDATARVVVLDVTSVPVMDVTGLVALESSLARLAKARRMVVIGGLQEQPAKVLQKAGLVDKEGQLALCRTLPEAIERARTLASSPGVPPTPVAAPPTPAQAAGAS